MRTLTSVLRASPVVHRAVSPHHAKAAAATRFARRAGHARGWASPTVRTAAAAAGSAGEPAANPTPGGISGPPAAFSQIESLISQTLGSGGPGGDWKQVEDCWVLYPPEGQEPKCLVHFVGGAFVGAAPQLAYRPLLEALAAKGALVVATPYATGFDHVRSADEVYFKYQRCLKALGPAAVMMPAFSLGHSFGSLLHLLIFSRYVVPSAGNVFMSFNNRPATDSIPFLSPFIAPSARALGPILSQLATSPLRSNVESWIDLLKGVSPPLVRQLTPLLEQLTPIYLDVANGAQEFNPPPEETRSIIRSGYTVPRNLLLRFSADTIDQTPELASTLQSSAIANMLELTVKTLPGEHVRPLQQDFASRISPDFVRVANQAVAQGNDWLGQLTAGLAKSGLPDTAQEQLAGLAKVGIGMANAVGEAVLSTNAADSIDALADEVASWMGLPTVPAKQTVLALPQQVGGTPYTPPPSNGGASSSSGSSA